METSVALDFLGDLRRTHTCGELRAADEGKTVVLMGWVHRRRDHGGVIFVDLRDRDGITQVVFHEDVGPGGPQPRRSRCAPEYVIAVEGVVTPARPGDRQSQPGHRRDRGGGVASIWILNESRTPPFPMEEQVDVAEDVRLKYRYVDLRRPHMQRNIILRSKIAFAVREYLYSAGLPGNRNAVHDALHAGGRARLPGAQPRAARHVSTRCRNRRRSSSSC